MGMAERTPTSAEELKAYETRLSNWGRWGADDERGTLNHITPEIRRRAAGLVRSGRSVSCAYPIQTLAVQPNTVRNYRPADFEVRPIPDGSVDYIGVSYHGMVNTHIDGFAHMYTDDGLLYNGRSSELVTPQGAGAMSVHRWAEGILTRGVLYDIPRMRGQDYLRYGEGIQGWDLEDCAKANGITPAAGDAVIVRSGATPFWAAHPDLGDAHNTPGLAPSVLEFLHDTDAALLVWDLMEDADATQTTFPHPIHRIAIPRMGLPLLDNADLEALGAACAEERRAEFMFTVAPLVVIGGTGSPVNPIATF